MAERILGRHKLDLICDLATTDLTLKQLAEKYGVSDSGISAFKQRHLPEIASYSEDETHRLAVLWITDRDKRIAEYERIYEDHESYTDPKSVRIKMDCLVRVAEEMGQLPQRKQSTPDKHEVVYRIEGVNPQDVV